MTGKWTRLALAAVIGVVLPACSSDAAEVASLTKTRDAQVAGPTKESADIVGDNEAAMMAFAQCLRDQGMEVYDPVVDSEGNVQKPELPKGVEWTKGDKAAWETCVEHLEGLTFEKEQVDMTEYLDQALALSTCLRDRGYDVGEPTAETIDQWNVGLKDVIDWEDPGALEDYTACATEAGMGAGKK